MTGFLVLVFVLEMFLSGYEKFRLYNAIENTLLAISLLSVVRITTPVSKWPFFQSLVCFIVLFIVLIEGTYFLIFDAVFSPSAIFIAMESYTSESLEFIANYFSIKVGVYLSFVVVIGFLLIRFEATRNSSKKHEYLYYLSIVFSLIGLGHPSIYSQNLPYTIYIGITDYLTTSKELSKQQNNKTGDFKNVGSSLSGDELFVFVIGESTNRNHMQLYGYNRKTNPKLTSIKDELKVYDDVISAHAYTIASLTRALRLNNNIEDGNIIQLLNAAKFKTFWLSNQAPIGLYETLVTKIGMTAQEAIFTSSETWFYKAPYDEILLPHFKKIAKQDGPKAVFIHLLGTHGVYDMRYPPEFKKFDPALNLSRHPKVDHYDNAVLYNDFIISEIINITRKTHQNSFMLYFSDHGEEVYDEIDYAGHTVDQNITKNMFEIPFVLWQSSAFQKHRKIEPLNSQKFSLENLSHAIADLCGVQSKEIDYTKSLFSEHFEPSPRIILDSLDFDLKFPD